MVVTKNSKSGTIAVAATHALTAYRRLSRRLPTKWYLIRDCTLNVHGELHFVQIVLLHRDHGIGLIDFRDPDYAFPELAVRLTRSILEMNGVDERFAGFLPVVFLSTCSDDPRALQANLLKRFEAEPKLGIAPSDWTEWAFDLLNANAEEGRRGRREEDPPKPEIHIVETPPSTSRSAMAGIALGMSACLIGAGGFLFVEKAASGPNSYEASITPRETARLLSEADVAKYLGLDPETFRNRQAALWRAGFPKPIGVVGAYDLRAVDHWIESAANRPLDPPDPPPAKASVKRPARAK
jgi:hypothetical protein